MGGCRCSYRDCSVRSDGKTHMFHFPVFDKIRCHQWIANAQRTDFLNLKLSQLKNRVVCQHHFKDDMFMNEMKGRLKQDALPTEDGPYCATKNVQVPEKVLPINIDDIENDFLSYNEKKAHMGVKYGDFLTNDVEIKDLQNQITRTIIIDRFDKYDANINYNIDDLYQKHKAKLKKEFVNTPSINVTSYKSKLRPKPETHPLKFEELMKLNDNNNQNVTLYTEPNKQNEQKPGQNLPVNITNMEVKKNKTAPERKITILSHKKITGPVKIEGKLEPVSASSIIEVPRKKRIPNAQINMIPDNSLLTEVPLLQTYKTEIPSQTSFEFKQSNETENQSQLYTDIQSNNENVLQTFNFEKELQDAINPPTEQNNTENNTVYPIFEPILNMLPVDTSQANITKLPEPEKTPNTRSLLKTKVPPEKKAEIEEKRKYNMKVVNVIHDSCLKKQNVEPFNINISKLLGDKQKLKDKTIESPPASSTNLTSPKKNSFAYIEKQLQKMEENLLSKIEENTQRIVQLKRTVTPAVTRRTTSTQTKEISEEVHKKQLYVEISKFLTPEANSLIYEELFINQFIEPSQKKRKVR